MPRPQIHFRLHFHTNGDDIDLLEETVTKMCAAFYGERRWTADVTVHPTRTGGADYYEATVEAAPKWWDDDDYDKERE